MRREINPAPTTKIIIGSIGVLYGAARLLTALLGGLDSAPADSPGYGTGQILGLVVAAAVLYFGARYARRGMAERKASHSGASVPATGRSSEAPPGSAPPPGS